MITKVLPIAEQISRQILWDLRGFFLGTLRNLYTYTGVTGGTDQTSGGCSLC